MDRLEWFFALWLTGLTFVELYKIKTTNDRIREQLDIIGIQNKSLQTQNDTLTIQNERIGILSESVDGLREPVSEITQYLTDLLQTVRKAKEKTDER